MRQNTQDLTSGNLPIQILRFSFPLMVTNVLQVLFNIADVAVVGRFAGNKALGAVSSTLIISIFFGGMILGFGNGINAITSFYCGSNNPDKISKAVSSSFIISLIIGAIFFAVAELLCYPLLVLIDTIPDLLDQATLYLRIIFCGLPAMAIYNFGNAVYSADGETRKPFYFLTAAGIINVILNLIFVIPLKMGVIGVALATVISEYVAAGCIFIGLIMSRQRYRLSLTSLHLDQTIGRSILLLGLPSGAQFGIFHLANMFFQYCVNSFDAAFVAGVGAASNADAIVYNMMASFYTAAGSFIGQNFGAKNRKRIKQSYLYCLLFSAIIGQVGYSIFIIFGRQFMTMFSTDPAVIEAGMYRLIYLGTIYGISALLDCTISASRALKHGIMPTIIVIIGCCIFRIVWIFTIFAHFHSVASLFLIYPVSWTITGIAELIYFIIIYHREMRRMQAECP